MPEMLIETDKLIGYCLFMGWRKRPNERESLYVWDGLSFFRCAFHTFPYKVQLSTACNTAGLLLREIGVVIEYLDSVPVNELRFVFMPDQAARLSRLSTQYNMEVIGHGCYPRRR